MAELTLTRDDKQRKAPAVMYTAPGYRGSIRISKTFFADKAGPASFTVADGVIPGLAGPRTEPIKLTKEERKALRAAQPKLTPAEKLARLEARAAKLRKQLEGQTVAA